MIVRCATCGGKDGIKVSGGEVVVANKDRRNGRGDNWACGRIQR